MVATLEISDGTTAVNLLQGTNSGFHLEAWRPAIAQAKRGGTFQSSALADGRNLVDRKFDNIIDAFDLKINNQSQNQLIQQIQDCLRLLEKATQYWTTDWQDDPVWIKAQAKCEDNARYSLIVNYKWEELDNPYSQPFYTPFQMSVMDNITLALEHKHWASTQPGTGECVTIHNENDWEYDLIWQQLDSTVGIGRCITKAPNGNLLAGGSGNIYISLDDGSSWAVASALPAGIVTAIITLQNGNMLAFDGVTSGGNNCYRSTNNGVAWALLSTVPTATDGIVYVFQKSDGTLLAVNDDLTGVAGLAKSTDNGAVWANVNTDFFGIFTAFFELDNGDIIASKDSGMSITSDDGTTWTQISATSVIAFLRNSDAEQIRASDNSILGVDTNDNIVSSVDNGETWQIRSTLSNIGSGLFTHKGLIFTSTNAAMYVSSDEGFTFQIDTASFPATGVYSIAGTGKFAEADSGDLIYGANNEIIGRTASTVTEMGHNSDICQNEIRISNKHVIANITHIKIDDGGVFTDIFPMAVFPTDLFPAVPAVNDHTYFGIDNSIFNDGPFDNLVFDLLVAKASTATINFQYWNGAWAALTDTDNTEQFRNRNVNSIHWKIPSDWVATAIDGITALWVRALVNGTSFGTIPSQQNRQIYSANVPYVEIASDQVLGDIVALNQIKSQNQSDFNGREATEPDLWTNRLVIGLRSVDRGSDFQAYINCSDTQNPIGIVATDTGANCTFTSDVQSPTGRIAVYNPAGVEAMATQVNIAFNSSFSSAYYGQFHAYLRVQRTAGNITDFDVQLEIVSGSGGISFTTESTQIQTTAKYEVLDFGQIEIPVASNLPSNELGDINQINIQASAASGTPNLNFYDLILMPVDECASDSLDVTNSDDSIVGSNDSIKKLLEIDSITNPKESIRSLVKTVDNERITSIYRSISVQEAILQANAQQRLWFFAMQTNATGSSPVWIAPPEIAHSVVINKQERYLGLIGEG